MEKEKAQFIETTGALIEKKGFSPIVSRVLTLLLVSDSETMNFYEIQETLKASKSAVSNGINYLLDKKYIEASTNIGDRKRYFRLNFKTWIELLKSISEEYKGYRVVLDQALELRSNKLKESNLQLTEIRDLYQLFENKLPVILSEWEAKNSIQS
ncbi:GbsR/MarR family transcriptional regulator [Marinoscillum sp.]|uniref:GbsR/MarR family transcriptional regulator n=1 Tax=Marinoscillum sp. TaxID=2024838 RepID=UPI003BADAC4C